MSTVTMDKYATSVQTVERYAYEQYLRRGVMNWHEKSNILSYVDTDAPESALVETAFKRFHGLIQRRYTYEPTIQLQDMTGEDKIRDLLPFVEDHDRVFKHINTGKLLYTSQPYFPAHTRFMSDEERAEYVKFHERVETRFSPEHTQTALARIRREVSGFAAQHDFDFDVTFDGSWYYPNKSVLIVLKQR